jgi:DNA-binding NarL/FixJ family response regulator
MSDRVAILGSSELFADAARVALQRAGLEIAIAAQLSDDVLDDVIADVVLLDAGSASQAIPWIRRLRESADVRGIVPVVEAADDDHVVAVLEAGASGWIERDATLPQLVRALRTRHAPASTRVLARVGVRIHALARELRRANETAEMLTARESQVLRLLAQDLSNKEIATRLGVWTYTVKTHLHNLYAKLGARSRREAVTRGMRLGLLRDVPASVRGQRTVADVMHAIFANEPRSANELLTALDASLPAVEDFERLASTADPVAMYKSLQPLLERYGPPVGAGRFDPFDFDYYRFLGHELLVTLMMVLLHDRRWSTAGDLLDERFTVSHAAGTHAPRRVTFGYASELVESLNELSIRRGVRSVHAELLESRHSRSFDDFVAADYFLFLRGELEPDVVRPHGFEWRPWSTARMRAEPWILRHPDELAIALRVGDAATLRARLAERAPRLELLWR